MNISRESWDALYAGQLRDWEQIADLQERLGALAKQVEKVSWMCEYMDRDEVNGTWVDGTWLTPTIEDAEAAWLARVR